MSILNTLIKVESIKKISPLHCELKIDDNTIIQGRYFQDKNYKRLVIGMDDEVNYLYSINGILYLVEKSLLDEMEIDMKKEYDLDEI